MNCILRYPGKFGFKLNMSFLCCVRMFLNPPLKREPLGHLRLSTTIGILYFLCCLSLFLSVVRFVIHHIRERNLFSFLMIFERCFNKMFDEEWNPYTAYLWRGLHPWLWFGYMTLCSSGWAQHWNQHWLFTVGCKPVSTSLSQ